MHEPNASPAKCVLLLITGPTANHVSLQTHYKLTCYQSCLAFLLLESTNKWNVVSNACNV